MLPLLLELALPMGDQLVYGYVIGRQGRELKLICLARDIPLAHRLTIAVVECSTRNANGSRRRNPAPVDRHRIDGRL